MLEKGLLGSKVGNKLQLVAAVKSFLETFIASLRTKYVHYYSFRMPTLTPVTS